MASQLAAWQTSVAAVRAFVGEERWPQDYDAARWARVAAALDLDRPRPSIVVLRAGDGCFAACPPTSAETVALDYHIRRRRPRPMRRPNTSAASRQHGAGRRRAAAAATSLATGRRAWAAADALEGLAGVRAAAFCAAPVERVAGVAPPRRRSSTGGWRRFLTHRSASPRRSWARIPPWRDALRASARRGVQTRPPPSPRETI